MLVVSEYLVDNIILLFITRSYTCLLTDNNYHNLDNMLYNNY